MHFPDRELQGHRSVYVLLLELVEGHQLSELPRYEFAELEAKKLVESIVDFIKVINASGIFLPTGLDERAVVDHISRKFKVIDFLDQVDRSECDDERQLDAMRMWFEE